jgi:hypothetical protein
MIMVAAMAGLVVVAGVGLLVDDRQLLHESIWAKPFKFAVSFVLYGATLAWMLPKLRRARRTMWTLGTVFAVTGLVDVGFIAVQAARGTYSHFNTNTDPFNAVGQEVFKSGVMGLFGASLLIAVMLLFQRVGERALTWSLRAGIALAVLGMGVAFFIAGSSEGARTVEDAYGQQVTLMGAHGVGVPDGGGMPITNWSMVGGDLRVPHFIGLHAIQALALIAVGLRRWRRPEAVRVRAVLAAAASYVLLFLLLLWEALRGQSVVAPDSMALALIAIWAAVSMIALGWIGFGDRKTA